MDTISISQEEKGDIQVDMFWWIQYPHLRRKSGYREWCRRTRCHLSYTLFVLHIICPTHYLSYTLFDLHIICPTHYLSYTFFVLHIICPTNYWPTHYLSYTLFVLQFIYQVYKAFGLQIIVLKQKLCPLYHFVLRRKL